MFSANKQMKRMQGHGCWKASFSVKKVSKWDFKSKAQVHEGCFLLMKLNVICIAEDNFHVLELFCRASHVRASMHRITNLRTSKNTNAVFSATKQMKRMQGHGCWKASFSVREKLLNAILWIKLKYMKDASFSWNVICNAEDRFSCVRAFLQSKSY